MTHPPRRGRGLGRGHTHRAARTEDWAGVIGEEMIAMIIVGFLLLGAAATVSGVRLDAPVDDFLPGQWRAP
jgi:hypothetical protein